MNVANGSGGRIAQVVLQRVGALVEVIRDLSAINRRYDSNVLLGAREDDVQPLLPTALIDRSEVQDHTALGVGRVADADDDNITFVAFSDFGIARAGMPTDLLVSPGAARPSGLVDPYREPLG